MREFFEIIGVVVSVVAVLAVAVGWLFSGLKPGDLP